MHVHVYTMYMYVHVTLPNFTLCFAFRYHSYVVVEEQHKVMLSYMKAMMAKYIVHVVY